MNLVLVPVITIIIIMGEWARTMALDGKLEPFFQFKSSQPGSQWDWVEVPCSNEGDPAAVDGDVNIGPRQDTHFLLRLKGP